VIDALLARGLVPDALIRMKIRSLLRQRLEDEGRGGLEAVHARFRALLEQMREAPVALHTREANEQHYEVPPAFYERVLGRRLKYSCALFEPGDTLDAAEERMLALTCARAGLADGQRILELGCGWGSLSLWMAERYPNAQVTGVSNSRDQRAFIEGRAKALGLRNLTILTADMNAFEPPERGYDRVVSVEMFEHMRNHRELMRRIASWLAADGRLFVHIFTHRDFTYLFEAKDDSDWMAREFFTGGIMPADHLLFRYQEDLRLEDHWRVSGAHYQATAEAWLKNQDAHRGELLELFRRTCGPDQAALRFARWRIFFMACAELWGWRGGEEWFVSHYLFSKRA
jgi:cyclopropane-fatty-acyl-phospholipid synthase